MADPKLKIYYTRIPNELLEAVIEANLTVAEYKTLLCFFRKTYGWGKKEDRISISQFKKSTRLSRTGQINALKRLVKYKILLVNRSVLGNTYSLQKDYSEWVVNRGVPSQPARHQLVNQRVPTSVETLTKETLTSDKSLERLKTPFKRKQPPEWLPVIEIFLKERNQTKLDGIKVANEVAAKKLVKNYTLEKVLYVIRNLKNIDDEWIKSNTTSITFLAKRFEQIIKLIDEYENSPHPGGTMSRKQVREFNERMEVFKERERLKETANDGT